MSMSKKSKEFTPTTIAKKYPMIKTIEVLIEHENGIGIKTIWCHPALRTPMVGNVFGKTSKDPREWFDKILKEYNPSGSETDECTNS